MKILNPNWSSIVRNERSYKFFVAVVLVVISPYAAIWVLVTVCLLASVTLFEKVSSVGISIEIGFRTVKFRRVLRYFTRCMEPSNQCRYFMFIEQSVRFMKEIIFLSL